VAVGSGLTPDLELDPTLTTFIADPRVMKAHAALALVLIDQHAVPAKVLRTVSADVRMAVDTPEGMADALRAALADVVRATESALATETGALARISHRIGCIGVPNQRKSLCQQSFSRNGGFPRCKQSVAQSCSPLHL